MHRRKPSLIKTITDYQPNNANLTQTEGEWEDRNY